MFSVSKSEFDPAFLHTHCTIWEKKEKKEDEANYLSSKDCDWPKKQT